MQLPWPVVLASASPRRQQLLRQLVPEFQVEVADVDETPLEGESPWQTAERLARLKARAVSKRWTHALVIAGDTVVAVPEKGTYLQLAKPSDSRHACDMLRKLSGRKHLVITGVCLAGPAGEQTFSVTTTVSFRELDEDEIMRYAESGEPMDKAGGYAIQGGAGAFVASTDGSRSNVIGFPLEEVAGELQRLAAGHQS